MIKVTEDYAAKTIAMQMTYATAARFEAFLKDFLEESAGSASARAIAREMLIAMKAPSSRVR